MQDGLWPMQPTYRLKRLELFNWGGFSGAHSADIHLEGTAVIGPTGSGKTTLVDALMTLLTANPKYNLASTGGHESDRDLPSYVRGISGPGDGSTDQSHIARPGKTVTGICATLLNGESVARLGAILWFDDSSSSSGEMKKLWFFGTDTEHTLSRLLQVHHQGGIRALQQFSKTETGIWTYKAKKTYLARIRDFFEVRDNAFNLLNRAAGLKQLNSIDEIFRELVLDDNSRFDRAREVADSFDDLTGIHEELVVARKQQRSLEPVKSTWEKCRDNQSELTELETLSQAVPIWFGEQGYRLWKQAFEQLSTAFVESEQTLAALDVQIAREKQNRDALNQAYLQLGGSDIATLEQLVEARRTERVRCQQAAEQYQMLTKRLSLDNALTQAAFQNNQRQIREQQATLLEAIEQKNDTVFALGAKLQPLLEQQKALQQEIEQIRARPGSNISLKFQQFRSDLASELSLSEVQLPFVAELVQVKPEQGHWRGAIERALGSHRLRILVPASQMKHALRWVNSRHNRLHVRLWEVTEAGGQPVFFEDGFLRKLDYKTHDYREALKQMLVRQDRHCVSSPEALAQTPKAMTEQGLMSGNRGYFDKQDQKKLTEDWLTGFDNKDRLLSLQNQLQQVQADGRQAGQALEVAKSEQRQQQQQNQFWQKLSELGFSQIDLASAQVKLDDQLTRLKQMTAPDSDTAKAKAALAKVDAQLNALDQQRSQQSQVQGELKTRCDEADREKSRAYRRQEEGLTDDQRTLAATRLPVIDAADLTNIADLERASALDIGAQVKRVSERQNKLEKELIRCMAAARGEDRGALAEVGQDIGDVPKYLERLEVLTEEALPEKLKRFKEYLNQSSDDGVTQLLASIQHEVVRIEDRLKELNDTLQRVDFQVNRYLQLVSGKVTHQNLKVFQQAQKQLNSARMIDDDGESHFKALQHIVALLRDACERHRTLGAKALLDPRFRLEFKVSVIDRETGSVIETRSGSQGGSGGEKEIIASYVLTASLSYALCPDGSQRPLFGTIVLDEAFSRSSHVVAGRIIAALQEFGLHALFITPNKEMRLLRNHTRSAIVIHRRGQDSRLASLSWTALEEMQTQRKQRAHEITG